MGYLTEKQSAEIYRSIVRIGFNPSTGAIDLVISEGLDVDDGNGNVRFVATRADYVPEMGAESAGLINTPLSMLAPMLGLQDASELGALTMKQIIVGLVDAALTPAPAPEPAPDPAPEPAPEPAPPPADPPVEDPPPAG